MNLNKVSLTLNSVCVPSDDIVVREIEGDLIIVPLVAGIGDSDDELYTLNKTGKAIWQELNGEHTLKEVVLAISNDFEGDLAELETDILGFVTELTRRGMLVHQHEAE